MGDSYAQTNTENVNTAAEANTILDAIRAALEDLTAALPMLSDDLDMFESRISDLESKLDSIIAGLNANQTSDDSESSLVILESIQEVSEQLADLQTGADQFSGGSGPMQGMNGDGAPNPPVLSYARAEVVFDTISTEKAGDRVYLVKDNAMHGIILPRINNWLLEEVSPGHNDAPIIFRYLTLLYNAAFDAVAPYHSTAVGVYSRMEHRPALESETNLMPNTAVMHAAYRSMLEFAPHRADEWRDMMTTYGLDPDDEAVLALTAPRHTTWTRRLP